MANVRETMTSLERSKAVIEGRIPDRVPVCLLNFQNAARFMGYSVGECILDSQKSAKSQIAYWEEFRHDMIEIENGICVLSEAVGCEIGFAEDTPPWVSRRVLDTLEDVDKLRDVDLESSPCAKALLETTKIVADKLGATVCIRGDSDLAPFSLAAELMGMEKFLMALMGPEQKDNVHKLLRYCTEQVASLVRAQIAVGSHYTIIGDSTAGPDICPPKIYREFAAPYEKLLVHQFRKEGIEVGCHICGDATKIIDDMLETGALYFEVDYKIDRTAVHEAVKGKATIIGTVDPSYLLPSGTPEEVSEKAREDIQIFGPGGRFILGAGCSIPENTPFENVRVLINAASEVGWYDSEGQLIAFSNK